MNSADVIAYTYEGTVYCPDCFTDEKDNEEIGIIFADNIEEITGATCGTCGNCLNDSGEFVTDITDKRFYRWSKCSECGDRRPHEINGWGFRDIRLSALRGKCTCRNCRREAVHF